MGKGQFEPGTEFAGFRIERILGHGGMGSVYLATQIRLGRKVALKVLLPQWAENEEYRSRFIRESELAASIEHTNVLPVYDAGEVEGELYMAVRYIDGPNLRELLRAKRVLPLDRTLSIIRQVASALDAAHTLPLVHRDVKPANILLGQGDHAYLSDFGIARGAESAGMTTTGSFLGTVDYAAPEQIDGKRVDGQADVYSLGCVLYHCLAGQPPFSRETEIAVMKAQLYDPPPALSNVRPDLPRALDGVVVTAMAKIPPARYRTAGELAVAFDEAIADPAGAGLPITVTEPLLPETVLERGHGAPPLDEDRTYRSRGGRRTAWIAAGVIGGVVLAGGVGAAAVLALGSRGEAKSTADATTAPQTLTTRTTQPTVTRSEQPSYAASLEPQLRVIASRQLTVTKRVETLRSGQQSFARLSRAADDLSAAIARAQGRLDGVTPQSGDDAHVESRSRAAFAAHLEYADRLRDLPALPRSFTQEQATKIMADATAAQRTYDSLSSTDADLTVVSISPESHRHLLELTAMTVSSGVPAGCHDARGNITAVTPPSGVPETLPSYFASCDRKELCYATERTVVCVATPSQKQARLGAGQGATHGYSADVSDHGGPSLPEGVTFTSHSGAIRCGSSSRGITCADNAGSSFRIADFYVVINGARY